MSQEEVTFSPSIAFRSGTEVYRRTVRLMICDVCAAAVVHDPADDGALLERHAQWHQDLAGGGS